MIDLHNMNARRWSQATIRRLTYSDFALYLASACVITTHSVCWPIGEYNIFGIFSSPLALYKSIYARMQRHKVLVLKLMLVISIAKHLYLVLNVTPLGYCAQLKRWIFHG